MFIRFKEWLEQKQINPMNPSSLSAGYNAMPSPINTNLTTVTRQGGKQWPPIKADPLIPASRISPKGLKDAPSATFSGKLPDKHRGPTSMITPYNKL